MVIYGKDQAEIFLAKLVYGLILQILSEHSFSCFIEFVARENASCFQIDRTSNT